MSGSRFRRDDWQHHIVVAAGAEVNRGPAAENGGWPIPRIVMQERPAAGELVLHVGQPAAARALVDVVLAAHGEANAIAGGDDKAGRPDLDIELDDLTRPQ